VANTLAYYDAKLLTLVKVVIGQAQLMFRVDTYKASYIQFTTIGAAPYRRRDPNVLG
jgi:hypothetical protein